MKLKELCEVLPFRRYILMDKNANMFGHFDVLLDGYRFYIDGKLCSTPLDDMKVFLLIPEDDVVVIDIYVKRA